ncbi:MAG: type VI secretion system tip protein TssI/VgrG [Pedobacter sp.]
MPYTQDEKLIAIKTPLGKDVLLLTSFKGTEGISRLFSFDLTMVAEKHDISFDAIVGQNVTISVVLSDGSSRYFNGIISSFSQGRGGCEKGGNSQFCSYRATMAPWLWVLTQTSDIRIFQNKSAPDIIDKVFKDQGFKDYRLKLQGSYAKRDYCVQYRETDFNFVSRLMEEEGIYYFFAHEDGKHAMIISDTSSGNKPCPKQKSVSYHPSEGGWLEEDTITSLEMSKQMRVGKYSLADYNFEIPNTDLTAVAPSKTKLGPGEREVYDYPGLYGKKSDGDRLAKIRIEEEEAQITKVVGVSTCRAFTSGYCFKLMDYYRCDLKSKDYLLVSVTHEAVEGYDADVEPTYRNSFECIPYDVPFRPLRITPKPFVKGAQTAIVVGPSGEEIYPDKHGRVKVQFHWDREGKKDDKSSCWIRVSQAWAGGGWGAMSIPRIGQEVIVDFLEGDPDRPIITGRVYHGANPPPYALPADKTRSTIKSDSTMGGGGFNEIRFEDKKGSEEIYIQAEKDENILIKNNQGIVVGNDRAESIKRDRSLDVGRDKSEVVGRNKNIQVLGGHTEQIASSMSILVGSTLTETVAINYAETVGGAMELSVGGALLITVGAAMAETVGGAKVESIGLEKSQNIGKNKAVNIGKDYSEHIGNVKSVTVVKDLEESIGGQHKESITKEYFLNAKKIQIIAQDEINLKTGKAEIIMKKNGDITIKGKKINVKGSGDVIIKGSKLLEN